MPQSPNHSSNGSNDIDIESIVSQINNERSKSNYDVQDGPTEDPNAQSGSHKLQELERLAELEREHYRQKKIQKEQANQFQSEREKWEQERKTYDEQLLKNKPSKWLEQKGMSVKELADSIMNEQDEDGTPENEKLDYQEALQKAVEQLEGKFEQMYEQKRSQEIENYEIEEAYDGYKNHISEFLQENIDQFPALVGFGGQDHVLSMIENEYNEIEEHYGEEYADKWLGKVDIGAYANEVQKNIEQGLISALQLPQMRSYVERILQQTGQNDRNFEPRNDAPKTLTKNNFASPSGRYDAEEMTEQERINAAIKMVQNR